MKISSKESGKEQHGKFHTLEQLHVKKKKKKMESKITDTTES